MMIGSSAASTAVWIRAIGRSPSSRGPFRCGHQQRRGAVGDLTGVARGDHAVLRANAGRSAASAPACRRGGRPRRPTPARRRSAVRAPARSAPSNRPASCAAAAFSWEARLYSSSCSRVRPQRSAIISAPTPWLRHARRRTAPVQPLRGERAAAGDLQVAPIGTRDIDSTPPATTTSYCPAISPAAAKCTDCWEDPHCRSMVTPGTDSGQPAASTALRAMSKVCSPTWQTHPDDVVDQARVDAGALRQRPQHVRRQVDGVDAGQSTVALADRGPDGLDDHRVTHLCSPHRSPLPAPSAVRSRVRAIHRFVGPSTVRPGAGRFAAEFRCNQVDRLDGQRAGRRRPAQGLVQRRPSMRAASRPDEKASPAPLVSITFGTSTAPTAQRPSVADTATAPRDPSAYRRPACAGPIVLMKETARIGEPVSAHHEDIGGLDERLVEVGGAVVVLQVAPDLAAGGAGGGQHRQRGRGQVEDGEVRRFEGRQQCFRQVLGRTGRGRPACSNWPGR